MLLLVSTLAFAWGLSETLSGQETLASRSKLAGSALCACVFAKFGESFVLRALSIPIEAVRLHARLGPVGANIVMNCAFFVVCYAHARARFSRVTLSTYLACARIAVGHIAPAAAALLIFASTAALFVGGIVDRLVELVLGRRIDAWVMAEWRWYGGIYAVLLLVYWETQWRCRQACGPLPLPRHTRAWRRGRDGGIIGDGAGVRLGNAATSA